uniref:GIY-YIG domain-containing protein n=1 Tax=Panagrolaimus sp. ES5 TaxID=591445 RepID=A0AC34GAZ5_9BILA
MKKEHRQEYEHLLSSERQWDNYLQWQATLGSWGGQVELAAFTELYGVKVTILSEITPPQTHGPANATLEYFIIHRNGNHYNGTFVNNDISDADDAEASDNDMEENVSATPQEAVEDIFTNASARQAGVTDSDPPDVKLIKLLLFRNPSKNAIPGFCYIYASDEVKYAGFTGNHVKRKISHEHCHPHRKQYRFALVLENVTIGAACDFEP